MFEHDSRYARIGNALYVTREGDEIVYKQRRFLPRGETLPVLTRVTVGPLDRLDLIAARTLGDPLRFWLIADANDALDPWDLTDTPGRVLRIPRPQPGD